VYARGETGALTARGTNHEELGVLQDGETFEIEIQHLGKLSLDVGRPTEIGLELSASIWIRSQGIPAR
jgi:hypothetical protein